MVKVNIRRYEAPVTHRVLVELEDGFCGSAPSRNPSGSAGEADNHNVNNKFGYEFEPDEISGKVEWDK